MLTHTRVRVFTGYVAVFGNQFVGPDQWRINEFLSDTVEPYGIAQLRTELAEHTSHKRVETRAVFPELEYDGVRVHSVYVPSDESYTNSMRVGIIYALTAVEGN